METVALEKHYRVKELASLWGLSPRTVTRIFAEEGGVIRVANDLTSKRKYATLSIPESVALRVHERLATQATIPDLPPLRTVRLNDVFGGLSKKSKKVVKPKLNQDRQTIAFGNSR